MSSETFEFQAEINQLMSLIINAFYSNKEIFLRELISNASDALDKIRYESLQNKEILKENSNFEIKIRADKENNKLIIEDNGIGMTKDDLQKCLGTIANSGTKQFIQNIGKSKDMNLIGQFGVGFYSSYLVADNVKVTSKHNNDKEYIWESSANGNYTITETENQELSRGTIIELTLKDDAKEYLDVDRIKDVIKKHSEYIQYPIKVYTQKTKEEEVEVEETNEIKEENKIENNDEIKIEDDKESEKPKEKKTEKITKTYYEYDQVNTQEPIWVKPTSEITDDEYKQFYKSLTGDYGDPMKYKHISVEGAVNFKALIYIPAHAPMNLFHMERERKDVKLYVKRVFITDDCENLVPQWLNFVKGVVDSDDIPLNVSREMLQQNKYMKLIKKSLTKKIIEMIEEIKNESDDEYMKFFLSFGKNIKLGLHEDTQYEDKLVELLKFRTSKSENKYITFKQYTENVKEQFEKEIEVSPCDECKCENCDEETKKDCCEHSEKKTEKVLDQKYKNIYYIVGEDLDSVQNSPFVQGFTKYGLEVVYMTEAIDEYLMKRLTQYHDFKFVNICNNDVDMSAYKEIDSEKENKEHEKLIEFLQKTLDKKVNKIKISNRLVDVPCMITTDNFGWSANMERIMNSQVLGDNQMKQFMVSSKTLEINIDHPIIKNIENSIGDEKREVGIKDIIQLMFDGALLSSGFSIEKPQEFVNKLNRMIEFGLSADEETLTENIEEKNEVDLNVSMEENNMENVD